MNNPVLDQERVAFIKGRIGSSPRLGVLSAWPRTQKELPLIDLEVTWVRFSTLNHRTRAEQFREIQRRAQADLFSSDPMGDIAQQAQYAILKGQDSFSELKDDLIKRRQQEPAVVTAEGVLINGNRRAAALRSLFVDDNHLDSRYLRCLVLPDDATPDEIVDLETELQIARDFKEEYSWVNEAMLIEELYDREGKSFSRVAVKMHRDMQDIKSLYEKIQQLNQLVDLSGGAYLHIDFKDNESAFDELAKHIRNKPRDEAESVRLAYYLGTLTGVNYRDLRHLRRPDAVSMIRKEAESDPTLQSFIRHAAEEAQQKNGQLDVLDDLLGPEPHTDDMTSMLSLLATKRRDQVIAIGGNSISVSDLSSSLKSRIEAAAYEAREEQRDQTAIDAPTARIDSAIAEINRARMSLSRARGFPDWPEERFRAKCLELRAAIHALESED